MSNRSVELNVEIDNTPEAVLAYVADVRNRVCYLSALKLITDVHDAGGYGAGTSWTWTWQALGMDFEGKARCTAYEPAKRYQFRTEGGLPSTWTYTAEPSGSGTKLTIRVEYDPPSGLVAHVTSMGLDPERMERNEADQVAQKLKVILDR